MNSPAGLYHPAECKPLAADQQIQSEKNNTVLWANLTEQQFIFCIYISINMYFVHFTQVIDETPTHEGVVTYRWWRMTLFSSLSFNTSLYLAERPWTKHIKYICSSDPLLPECHLQGVCRPVYALQTPQRYRSSRLLYKPPAAVPDLPDLHCTLSGPLCHLRNAPATHVHKTQSIITLSSCDVTPINTPLTLKIRVLTTSVKVNVWFKWQILGFSSKTVQWTEVSFTVWWVHFERQIVRCLKYL